jgi:prepilin-type N-terminal cleavage/methylation domain-containing protein
MIRPVRVQCTLPSPPVRTLRGRGFTLTELLVAIGVLALLLAVALPAIQASRETSRGVQCRNHLHQWGTALHGFEASHRRFPGAYTGIRNPVDLYSPHVALLPHVEQSAVQRRLDEDGITKSITEKSWWDSADWVREPLPGFLCPSDAGAWGTNYVFCTGKSLRLFNEQKGGVFHEQWGLTTGDVLDGLSNTIGVSEQLIAPPGLNRFDPEIHYWFTGLGDFLSDDDVERTLRDVCQSPGYDSAPFDTADGWQWFYASYGRTWYNHAGPPNSRLIDCSAHSRTLLSDWGFHTARSRHPGGVNTLAMDVAVRFVNESIDEAVWQSAATVRGGEARHAW